MLNEQAPFLEKTRTEGIGYHQARRWFEEGHSL